MADVTSGTGNRRNHYPLAEKGSGTARYAEAMRLYQERIIGADTLEVFRICAPDDRLDPLGELVRLGITADIETVKQRLCREELP
jgi:hypothetical protein